MSEAETGNSGCSTLNDRQQTASEAALVVVLFAAEKKRKKSDVERGGCSAASALYTIQSLETSKRRRN